VALKWLQGRLPPKWFLLIFAVFALLSSANYLLPSKTLMELELFIGAAAFLAFAIGIVVILISLALLYSKTARRNTAGRTFWAGASLLTLPLTLFLAYSLFSGYLPAGSGLSKFDAQIWSAKTSANYVANDFTPRQKMLKDVVENIIPGKSRDEIERLLGQSLETGYFTASERDLIYILGPERSFISIDSEWLLIWLDNEGQFERYAIYTD